MRTCCLTILFIAKFFAIAGQTISTPTTDCITRLSSYSQHFVDVFSFTANPSALALIKNLQLGIRMERRFMLSELNQYTICGAGTSRLGAFGFQLNYFGYEAYRDVQPGIAFAKNLGKVQLGIKFNYDLLNIPGYGSSSSLFAELGTVWHLSEKIHAGIDIHHPLALVEDRNKNGLSYSYSTGVGYELSPLVFFGFAISKVEDRSPGFNLGINYQFAQQFFARFGVSTTTAEVSFSAGWKWNSLRIEVTSAYHFRLGLTPGLMMIYQPQRPGD